jgi:hypothetical protein
LNIVNARVRGGSESAVSLGRNNDAKPSQTQNEKADVPLSIAHASTFSKQNIQIPRAKARGMLGRFIPALKGGEFAVAY